jgi:alpha-beta hydrolase superfamily lysophospholipase
MPIFKLNRNFTIRSLSGHVVRFNKNEPTHVPDPVIAEAVAIGAERVDAQQDALVDDDTVKAPVALVGSEREAAILKAIEGVVKLARRLDFTGQGIPTVKALNSALGFEIDRKELETMWAKYQGREE